MSIIGEEALLSQNERHIIRCGPVTVEQRISRATENARTNAAFTSSIHLSYFGRKPHAG